MTYQGGGEVSSANAIYVSLFDSSTFDNQPLAFQVVSENGGTASFSNLTASPVYVTALYDEQGGFDWVTVLSGTPAGTILDASYAPMAIELTEGETATAELTFDDTFRMP